MICHTCISFDTFRVKQLENAIKRSILCDCVSSQEHFVPDIIQANMLWITSPDDIVTVGTNGKRIKMLVLWWLFRGVSVISQSSSCKVILDFYYRLQLPLLTIPHLDLSSQSSRNNFWAVRREFDFSYFTTVSHTLKLAIFAKYVPHSNGLVPASTSQVALTSLTKHQRWNRPLVTAQNFHQLTSP
jgi:hypothetical protein